MISSAALVALAGCVGSPGEARTPPVDRITNGSNADSCQWPSTVALISYEPFCSGTLIHPRYVLTAAHCLESQMPSTIGFGEDAFNPVRSVNVTTCTSHPEYFSERQIDLGICELAVPVTDVPLVPVLMGCEQDVVVPDAEIAIAGFGNTQSTFIGGFFDSGVGLGTKRHVAQRVVEVHDDAEEVDMVGIDVQSGACHGDSGGGAFIQLDDGSWRVFAVAQSLFNVPGWPPGANAGGFGGTTTGPASTSSGGGGFIDPSSGSGVTFIDPTETGDQPLDVCGYGTTYSLVTPQMAWVEQIIADDVTPCFTADGAWDPNESCTPFPLEIDQAGGSWQNGCAGAVGGTPQCGRLSADTGTGTTGEPGTSTGEPGDSSTTSTQDPGETETTPTDGSGGTGDTSDDSGQDGDGGCGCHHEPGRSPAAVLLGLFGALALRRPRRGRVAL